MITRARQGGEHQNLFGSTNTNEREPENVSGDGLRFLAFRSRRVSIDIGGDSTAGTTPASPSFFSPSISKRRASGQFSATSRLEVLKEFTIPDISAPSRAAAFLRSSSVTSVATVVAVKQQRRKKPPSSRTSVCIMSMRHDLPLRRLSSSSSRRVSYSQSPSFFFLPNASGDDGSTLFDQSLQSTRSDFHHRTSASYDESTAYGYCRDIASTVAFMAMNPLNSRKDDWTITMGGSECVTWSPTRCEHMRPPNERTPLGEQPRASIPQPRIPKSPQSKGTRTKGESARLGCGADADADWLQYSRACVGGDGGGAAAVTMWNTQVPSRVCTTTGGQPEIGVHRGFEKGDIIVMTGQAKAAIVAKKRLDLRAQLPALRMMRQERMAMWEEATVECGVNSEGCTTVQSAVERPPSLLKVIGRWTSCWRRQNRQHKGCETK